ncbi:Glucan 1,6-alpha-glucosidase [Streptococcus pasteurianus]|nr:Glucan 1,6-alpha-glucosidase [Streptococcus pasteurianus]
MTNWWKKAVIYQIYPRSFKDSNGDGIGDIRGILEKLDYLKNLGIDASVLSPVYQSPMVDNGYDVGDYCKIDPIFGTLSDFDKLVNQSKKLGIRLIMDMVVNHTSDQHAWFQESCKSTHNSKRNFYIWRDQPIGNPSNWTYDSQTNQYYYHLFSPQQPDLNWENKEVRQQIYQTMNFWLDKGISGFRLDVIDLIGKQVDKEVTVNGPHLHDYLQEMHEATFGKRDCLVVGEAWSSSPELAKLYSAPERSVLSMVFGFWHILTSAGNGDKWNKLPLNVPKLKEALLAWQSLKPNQAWNALFTNNHDLPRIVSFWGDTLDYRERSAKAFAILFHLLRGTPFIYQGEELGMTNYPFTDLSEFKDIESWDFYKLQRQIGKSKEDILNILRDMSRDNARTPMQWTSDIQAGFTTGIPWISVNPNYVNINAKDALAEPQSIFTTYQNLIRLRHDEDWVTTGETLFLDSVDSVIAYLRKTSHQTILVVINLSSYPQNFESDFIIKRLIIGNVSFPDSLSMVLLQPWQAFAIEIDSVTRED